MSHSPPEGKISVADVKNTLIELGDTPTDSEVKDMMASVGAVDEIEFAQFLDVMSSKLDGPTPKDPLLEAFLELDPTGTGVSHLYTDLRAKEK
jgi:Ca2+-binding EF-hand superfamily protein